MKYDEITVEEISENLDGFREFVLTHSHLANRLSEYTNQLLDLTAVCLALQNLKWKIVFKKSSEKYIKIE